MLDENFIKLDKYIKIKATTFINKALLRLCSSSSWI